MPSPDETLALAHHQAGRLAEAEQVCRQIIAAEPTNASAWYLLGLIVDQSGDEPHQQRRLDEAIACYQRALELTPQFIQAHHNLGNAFYKQGRYEDAHVSYQRAIDLQPDLAEAQWNQAALKLLHGDFDRGWQQYEWRWKTVHAIYRTFQQAQWGGESLIGGTILLHAEQGIGDTIQFVRYAAEIKRLGATVLLACARPLFSLLSTCPGIDRLIGQGDIVPPFDTHAPLLSLPRIFKTTLTTIPVNVPYLFADLALVAHWRQRLERVRGYRIGINWHG